MARHLAYRGAWRRPMAAIALALPWTAPASAQIVADFEASKLVGITPMFVQFTNLSTYPNDPNIHFFWDFGDGEFGVGPNPSHLYMTEGVFSVSLAIHHNSQEVATKTREGYITTYDLIVDFEGEPRLKMPPFTTDFANYTSTIGKFPTTFLWEFGDGSTSTAVHPSHTYVEDGILDVTLHAFADGKSASLTFPEYIVSVTPNPSFEAAPREGVAPLDVQFSNGTVALGLPVEYLWDFGNGKTSTEVHPRHRYAAAGIYTVSLRVTTGDGEVLNQTRENYIGVTFETDFVGLPKAGRVPFEVQFENRTAESATDATFLWNFGDGGTSTERHPTHTYTNPGLYSVTLTTATPSETRVVTKPDYIHANTIDHDGRTFFVAFPWAFGDYPNTQQILLTISAPEGASGTIRFPGVGYSENFTLGPRQAKEFLLPLSVEASEPVSPKGGIITTNKPIQVFGLNRQRWSTDGYAAHPYDALGFEYRDVNAVVATSPGTSVVVRSRTAINVIELEELDVALVGAGELVTSNKPIAAYTWNRCGFVDGSTCDHMLEQVPPINVWGTDHIVARMASPTRNRLGILAHQDNTEVTILPGETRETLNAGQWWTTDVTSQTRVISTKPVLVLQYLRSGQENDDIYNGDPSVMQVIPTERFLSEYVVVVPEAKGQEFGAYDSYLTLVVKLDDILAESILLDGEPVAIEQFVTVTDTEYAVARVPVTRGKRIVESENPFGLYLYGFARFESYAYAGGLDITGLYEVPQEVSPEEVLLLRELFRDYDTNDDGLLSEFELSPAGIVGALFDYLDINGDGFVSVAELLTISVGPVGVTSPVYVDFNRLDVGRGTLLEPFNLFHEAQVFVSSGGVVSLLDGASLETFTSTRRLNKPIQIRTEYGTPVSIGGLP